MVQEEGVISKSRVWPMEWVGKLICCIRDKSERRFKKCEVVESGWLTWKLKFPVIITSDLDVARSSSRQENSEIKSDFEKAGGRYIVRRIKVNEELLGKEKLAQIDSNDANAGKIFFSFLRKIEK